MSRSSQSSELLVVYFMRRNEAQARANLLRLLEEVPLWGGTLVVLDKTKDSIASREWVPASVSDSFHVRPHDEFYFTSAASVEIPDTSRVMQIHDDDTCIGIPELAADSISAVLPVALSGGQRDQQAHPSLFFGAIHGRVWNAFMSHVLGLREPPDSIDLVLGMWLEALGVGPWIQGYEYHYDPRNWSTTEVTDRNNTAIAGRAGWGTLSCSAAIRWTVFLDALSSLNSLADLDEGMARVLCHQLLADPPPKFAPGLDRWIAGRSPSALRWRISTTRGDGRGPRRALALAKAKVPAHLSRQEADAWRFLNAGIRPTSLTTLAECSMPELEGLVTGDIRARIGEWKGDLIRLRDRIGG